MSPVAHPPVEVPADLLETLRACAVREVEQRGDDLSCGWNADREQAMLIAIGDRRRIAADGDYLPSTLARLAAAQAEYGSAGDKADWPLFPGDEKVPGAEAKHRAILRLRDECRAMPAEQEGDA